MNQPSLPLGMRDGKPHLDCAPLAPSHTGAHHAVYSIGKIVCRVSEPCCYNSANLVSSIRVTEAAGQRAGNYHYAGVATVTVTAAAEASGPGPGHPTSCSWRARVTNSSYEPCRPVTAAAAPQADSEQPRTVTVMAMMTVSRGRRHTRALEQIPVVDTGPSGPHHVYYA
jgi:hypothetical protein